MIIDFQNASHSPVMEAELEPPASVLERSSSDSEAEIKLLFTKRNRVAVYDLAVQKLTETVDTEILDRLKQKWAHTPSLLVVCVRLGCLPDQDCKFTWLRVAFDLGQTVAERELRPVACKLYPEDSKDKVKEVKSVEISSKLGFKVLDISTPELSEKKGSEREYESNQYQIITSGRLSPRPAWDFRATDVNPEIAGDLTLLLVVALRPDITATAEIAVSAKVQLRTGGIDIPLVTKRTSEGALKSSFKLQAALT